MTTKNYTRKLLIGLMLLTATLSFISCEKDENKKEKDPTEDLIGTWLLVHQEGHEYYNGDQDVWDKVYTTEDNNTLTINNDKTYVEIFLDYTNAGTWSYMDGIFTTTNEDQEDYYSGSAINFETTITATTLILDRSERKDNGNELYNKATYTKIQ